MKNKLAIFDLDGTLFDTSYVNYYSYKEALESYQFFTMPNFDEYKINWNGRSYKEFLPLIIKDKEIIEKVHDKKVELYEKNLDKARINEHLFLILEKIHDIYFTAIVTTASKKNTYQILKHFKKESLFDYIVTKEDITKVKPDPEGFIKAINHFGISLENTIIFEDSNIGIEAARATNANVFTINKF